MRTLKAAESGVAWASRGLYGEAISSGCGGLLTGQFLGVAQIFLRRDDQDETPHCLVENVPEYSTVASHKLLPTEG
jgi:hypothetical protein